MPALQGGLDAQGKSVSACKQGCGLPVEWRKQSVKGKRDHWQCFNAGTNTTHWDACSAARTKRVMAEGVPFKDEKGEGFIYGGKKKYFLMEAKTEFGKPVKEWTR